MLCLPGGYGVLIEDADQPLAVAEGEFVEADVALDITGSTLRSRGGPGDVVGTSSRIVRPARARPEDPRVARPGLVADDGSIAFILGLEFLAVGRRGEDPDRRRRPSRSGGPRGRRPDAQPVKIEASRSAHVNTSGRLSATIAAASPATIALRQGGRRRAEGRHPGSGSQPARRAPRSPRGTGGEWLTGPPKRRSRTATVPAC